MDEEVEGREEGRGGKEEMPKNRLAGQVKTQHSIAQDQDIKASLYTNDSTIFVKPQKQDIAVLKKILEIF
jgi:hypothetical protein